MNRPEWLEVVQRIRANWPHSEVPDASIAKWYDDLKDHELADVLTAVESLYRDGESFAPNGGQILARLVEFRRDDPDFGEAWALMNEAARRFGFHREHQPTAALAWLDQHSPSAAEAIARFGLDSFAMRQLDNEGTDRAQMRDIYKAVCRERQREGTLAGLPQPRSREGLRKLRPLEIVRGNS